MNSKSIVILIMMFFISFHLLAQPPQELINVQVSPDKADWTYHTGDRAEFTIRVLKNKVLLDGLEISYRIEPELVDTWEEASIILKNGVAKVKADKFMTPGFLRCTASLEVDGKTYSSYATAGFSPYEIEPTTTLPDDFWDFWEKGKVELAHIPVEPVLTLLPERCTDKVEVYQVSMHNIQGKIYGILCTPKAEGKYPAILYVPGAGVHSFYGDVSGAEAGFITLTIGIHGIPLNLDPGIYRDLMQGALSQYWTMNMDDRDNYYYKRVYLGCIRAVDFIETIDCYDGENIAVSGGSQGGALSIVTAALDARIDYLAALFPALSDLTGFLHDRAGGWPQVFRDDFTNKSNKIETSKYFDVVNFARFLQVPGWYSWGYNDNVCPPTSMFSAYNVINAPKELHLFQESQHWTFPEQMEMRQMWLFEKLRE